MKLTIDKKVGLFISTLIFVFGSLLGMYFVKTNTELMNLEVDEWATVFINNLAANLEYPVLIRDQETVSRLVKAAMAQKDIVFCRVEGRDGALLYQEGRRENGPVRAFSAPIVTTTGVEGEALILDLPQKQTEEIGTVVLTVSLLSHNQQISDIERTITTLIVIAVMIASLGSYLLLKRLIGTPIRLMVEATKRVSRGDLAHKIVVPSRDELSTLAASFNQMTDSLRNAQEDLVRKEKLAVLGQVAGIVGHELRNPLGVMNNAVYLLKTVLTEADPMTREYLDMISTEIAGAERIVSELLDSVRTRPPQRQRVDSAELLRQTLTRCAIPERVQILIEIPTGLPPIEVDPQQIQQVLRNVITNGIDAIAGAGSLTINAVEDHHGGMVRVSVRDTGAGITPEQMAQLFQPLHTTKARGIGLGLVVVKKLTEANGGSVGVQSEPGKGTTFTLALPSGAAITEAA